MTEPAPAYAAGPHLAFDKLLDLSRRSALVTGGGMGIGLAVTQRLLEAGADVTVAALDEGDLGSLQAGRDRLRFVACDVTQPQSLDRLFGEIPGLDILVNNAGIYPLSATEDVTPDFFDRLIGVNLRASFFVAQRAMAKMRETGRGGIVVNLSSICGHRPMRNHAVYDTTKGGILALTRNLALSGAPHGIRVNSISPGLTATPGNMAPELFPATRARRNSGPHCAAQSRRTARDRQRYPVSRLRHGKLCHRHRPSGRWRPAADLILS